MDELERYLFRKHNYLCGIDEVGRGALFGPVVAAAVVLSPDRIDGRIKDSKKLTPAARNTIARAIYARARDVGIGWSWNEEIDEINILEATKLAMMRAVESMERRPDYVLIDALTPDFLNIPGSGIIRGDEKSVSIAAASIVAKVFRDGLMEQFADHFPDYCLAQNKGYPTRVHLEVLSQAGLSYFHRQSFRRNCGL